MAEFAECVLTRESDHVDLMVHQCAADTKLDEQVFRRVKQVS